jgi:hypothetical protein
MPFEAGNDLNKIMNLVAKFTAEVIGDLSIIALLNPHGDKLRIGAYYDTNVTAQSLLRKLFMSEFEYDHSQTLGGSVIKTGEPLLIPLIPPEQLQAVTLPALQEFIDTVGIESVLIANRRSGVVGTISLSRHRGSKPTWRINRF